MEFHQCFATSSSCKEYKSRALAENCLSKAYRGHWVKCDPSCHARTGGICGRSVLPAFPMWKSYLKEFLVGPACHNRFRMFHQTKVISWQDLATCVAEIMVGDQHVDNQIIFADIPRYKTIKHRWIFTRSKNLWSHKPNHWSFCSNHHGASCKENQDRLQCLVETPKRSHESHATKNTQAENTRESIGSNHWSCSRSLLGRETMLSIRCWSNYRSFAESQRICLAQRTIGWFLLCSRMISNICEFWMLTQIIEAPCCLTGGVHFGKMFYRCWCNPILKQIAKTELERQIEVKVEKRMEHSIYCGLIEGSRGFLIKHRKNHVYILLCMHIYIYAIFVCNVGSDPL